MSRRCIVAAALVAASWAGQAVARDNFELQLTVDGTTGQAGFGSVQQLIDGIGTSSLANVVPGYTDNSAALLNINARGVPATGSFPANSTALRVVIPAANIDQTFQGATREESVRLFQRFLEGRTDGADRDAVSRLLRAGTRFSPIDPVAGGPNSALTQMGVQDFAQAAGFGVRERPGFGFGAAIGAFSSGGFDSTNITIPIDAVWRITDRDTVAFEVPFAYSDANGAQAYGINAGAIYRRVVTDQWTVQASGRFGAAGSIDLGAGTIVYGLGIASNYRFRFGEGWSLAVVNTLSQVGTLPVSIGRYDVDYNLSQQVWRNGVVLSRATGFAVAGYPLRAAAYFTDTRFSGSPTFTRWFQEVGLLLTPAEDARFGLGIHVMYGDRDLFGVTVSTGVKF